MFWKFVLRLYLIYTIFLR